MNEDAPREPDGTGRPVWLLPIRLLERSTRAVIVVAMITGLLIEAAPSWGHLAYVVSAAGLVLVRRVWSLGLTLVAVAPTLSLLLGGEPITLWTVASFTTFLLTLRGSPPVRTAAVTGIGNGLAQWLFTGAPTGAAFIAPGVAALTAVAAAAVGSAIRGNNQYWSALEQRAVDAVASRELVVRQSIAEERVRIARDLHDSVGHAVAVVNMRLGSAEVQLPAGSDAARAELAAARGGVQDVLREMQQILQVLRVEDEGQTLAPTPDASGVEQLVAVARAAGLDLEVDLGEPGDLQRPLPSQVGSATYRIVQEALTNVQKHGSGSARLRVDVAEDGVRIEVSNRLAHGASPTSPGSSPAASSGAGHGKRAARGADKPSGGHGLVGMRERATAAGGQLEVLQEDGSFRVRAHLPVRKGDTR